MKYKITKEEIRARRERLGISREQMASDLDISYNTVVRWETEGRGLQTGTTRYAILKYFEEKEKEA